MEAASLANDWLMELASDLKLDIEIGLGERVSILFGVRKIERLLKVNRHFD